MTQSTATASKAKAAAPSEPMAADSSPAALANASVAGIVSDPTGAVIPGATITATSAGTGQTYKATSDKNGNFTLPSLAGDTYQLSFESPGFMRQQQSLLLAAGSQAKVNATLTVGASSQQVTVQAELAPMLNTENADSGKPLTVPAATAAQSVQRRQAPTVFEITTEAGDRWTSTDGQRWTKR